jgi:hypothetical protein
MGALIIHRFLSNGDAVIVTDAEESALMRLRSTEGQPSSLRSDHDGPIAVITMLRSH